MNTNSSLDLCPIEDGLGIISFWERLPRYGLGMKLVHMGFHFTHERITGNPSYSKVCRPIEHCQYSPMLGSTGRKIMCNSVQIIPCFLWSNKKLWWYWIQTSAITGWTSNHVWDTMTSRYASIWRTIWLVESFFVWISLLEAAGDQLGITMGGRPKEPRWLISQTLQNIQYNHISLNDHSYVNGLSFQKLGAGRKKGNSTTFRYFECFLKEFDVKWVGLVLHSVFFCAKKHWCFWSSTANPLGFSDAFSFKEQKNMLPNRRKKNIVCQTLFLASTLVYLDEKQCISICF